MDGPEPSGQGGPAGSARGLRGLGPACVVVLQALFANTAPRRRAGARMEQWVSSVRADVEQVLGVRLAWEHRGGPQVRPEGDGGCTRCAGCCGTVHMKVLNMVSFMFSVFHDNEKL